MAPRTLSVDSHLLDNHFDTAVAILSSVIRAEEWALDHPQDTCRFLAHETNSSEYWVTAAYGEDAHQRLRTNLDERSVHAVQDFTDFLQRWNFIPTTFSVNDWVDNRPSKPCARHWPHARADARYRAGTDSLPASLFKWPG